MHSGSSVYLKCVKCLNKLHILVKINAELVCYQYSFSAVHIHCNIICYFRELGLLCKRTRHSDDDLEKKIKCSGLWNTEIVINMKGSNVSLSATGIVSSLAVCMRHNVSDFVSQSLPAVLLLCLFCNIIVFC